MWSGDAHYSDSQFIQISMTCPIHFFRDRCHNCSWQYRELGDRSNPEAVILLPGIRETVSSYFHLMPALNSRGYRVVSVSFQNSPNYIYLTEGFNELMLHLQIRYAHFVGNDLGGFIALQIASAPKKVFLTKSITLINYYASNQQFKGGSFNSIKLLKLFSAKSDLLKEFEKFNVYQNPSQSLLFVSHEVETISSEDARVRVELRQSHALPLDVTIPDKAIMVIDISNRIIQYSEDSDPMKKFPDAILSIMKEGGDWPHLEAPQDLIQYLLVHLRKWTETMKIDEQQAESTQQ